MAKASLGAIVSDVRGRIGEEVLTRVPGGAVVRGKPTYRRPTNPSQAAVESRMRQATAVYNAMTRAQSMAWNAYAATLTHVNRVTGQTYTPSGQKVFVGLATKFLQINPTGTVPITPPTTAFVGDRITVSGAGIGGAITFTASGANAAGVKTELLVQPLKTQHRSPTAFYKSALFVAFAAGTLTVTLPYAAGWYALAYRFVNPSTGQALGQVEIGVVQVT